MVREWTTRPDTSPFPPSIWPFAHGPRRLVNPSLSLVTLTRYCLQCFLCLTQDERFFFLAAALAATAEAATRPLPDFSLRGVDRFDLFAGIVRFFRSAPPLFPYLVQHPGRGQLRVHRERRAPLSAVQRSGEIDNDRNFLAPLYARHTARYTCTSLGVAVCACAHMTRTRRLHSAPSHGRSPLRPPCRSPLPHPRPTAASFEIRAARLDTRRPMPLDFLPAPFRATERARMSTARCCCTHRHSLSSDICGRHFAWLHFRPLNACLC